MLMELCNRIAEKISKNTGCDSESKEVIAYGVMAILHTFIFILFIVIVGLIFNMLVPILIVCLSAAVLKRSSGGAHADTPFFCTFIGSIVCFAQTGLAIVISSLSLPLYIYIAFSVICLLTAFYFVYKKAPVDSANKPINTDKKKKRLRRNSFITLICYGVVIAVFLCIGETRKTFILYSVCFCFGLLWQSFMLTALGQSFIKAIQSFLRKFIKTGA